MKGHREFDQSLQMKRALQLAHQFGKFVTWARGYQEQLKQGQQFLETLPGVVINHVKPGQKGEAMFRVEVGESTDGIDGVVDLLAFDLKAADFDLGVLAAGQFQQLDSLVACLLVGRTVGRSAAWHHPYLVKLELFQALNGQSQVTIVNGVEAAPEE